MTTLKTNTATAFLQKWLNISDYDLAINSDFEYEALQYNIDLTRKYYAVVTKVQTEDLQIKNKHHLNFNLDATHQIFIFKEFDDSDNFTNQFKKNILLGIGTPHYDLSRTIKEGLIALCFATPNINNICINFTDIKQFTPLINSNLVYPELCQFFDGYKSLYGDTTLIDTFWLSILNNHNFTKTANELHVHRKTIEYRLDRLQDLTGYNPRDIIDCIALISAYIRFRTKNLSIRLNELQSISDGMLPRD